MLTAVSNGQTLGPDELVDKVTAEVLEAVTQDKILQAGDRVKSIALAEQKIVPHIDFAEATRLAVGKSWRAATPAQQETLVREFRTLLVRTYAAALEGYRDEVVKRAPTRLSADGTEARVRNLFLRSGTPAVTIDYYMKKATDGWKVYDITVEAVSLVQTYRESFAEEVVRGGIDGLIARLIEKNQQPIPKQPPRHT
jgi:phospholipid transport system substrate-binding protein